MLQNILVTRFGEIVQNARRCLLGTVSQLLCSAVKLTKLYKIECNAQQQGFWVVPSLRETCCSCKCGVICPGATDGETLVNTPDKTKIWILNLKPQCLRLGSQWMYIEGITLMFNYFSDFSICWILDSIFMCVER